MSAPVSDSMWLQKSISVADPIPEANQSEMACTASADAPAVFGSAAAPTVVTEPQPKPVVEMDLTRMVLDTSALIAHSQRPSSARYSVRASVSNSAFISAQEYDDLRMRFSQAKRELLKLSDIQKDLDFSRFELTRAKEELKLERDTNASLKNDLEEAIDKVEAERKTRNALESKMHAEAEIRVKEVEFLKAQIEQLRHENTQRLAEMTEQQESEYQTSIQALRDELANTVDEMQSMAEKLAIVQAEKEAVASKFQSTLSELEGTRANIADLQSKFEQQIEQYHELVKEHSDYVSQCEKAHEEELQSQVSRHEERVQHLAGSKDECIRELKEELQQSKEKCRSLASELAAVRHTSTQLEEELKQLAADHAKEMRRIAEEHRLALCEKQLQLESSVREAKGSKTSVEEENQSLRRQLAKVSEELSTVAAVLAQRERQVGQLEKELTSCKETLYRMEQESNQLVRDADAHCGALDEANDRISRINEQKDKLEEEFMNDLRQAKDRVRVLEGMLMEQQNQLTNVRRERVKADEDDRQMSKKLRVELEGLMTERGSLQHTLAALQQDAKACNESQRQAAIEKGRADNLAIELRAAVDRCSALERRLNDELRQRVADATAPRTSPRSSMSGSCSHQGTGLRSVSSINVRNQSCSLKRARTEDARVLALTGFDGNELFMAIKQLPNVAIADCKSNMAVPSNLTHLITKGQLTIKLLTALVRGCWVLPETYVLESLKQRTWLPESEYGFQHADPPLLKKRIAVTEAFMSSKHYATAKLILKEGGAIMEGSTETADIVLCTNGEVDSYGENAINWERMVEVIYPCRIS